MGLSSTSAGLHLYPSNCASFLSLLPPPPPDPPPPPNIPPRKLLFAGASGGRFPSAPGVVAVGLELGPFACGANGGPYLARVPICERADISRCSSRLLRVCVPRVQNCTERRVNLLGLSGEQAILRSERGLT